MDNDHLGRKTHADVRPCWTVPEGRVYAAPRWQDSCDKACPAGSFGVVPPKQLTRRPPTLRLRRFGRGGFVQIAMRAGVPVVPIAVVGAEESMPTLFKINFLAKALGIPYFPVTANQLLFGPVLGNVMYFPSKFRLRVLDPVYFDVPPDQDRYSKSRIMDESENIRVKLQENLYDMLRTRTSVWFG